MSDKRPRGKPWTGTAGVGQDGKSRPTPIYIRPKGPAAPPPPPKKDD